MPVYVIDFPVSGEITPDASFRKWSPERTFNLWTPKTKTKLSRLSWTHDPLLLFKESCSVSHIVGVIWEGVGGFTRAEWKHVERCGWVWCRLKDSDSSKFGSTEWSEPMKCGETNNVLQLRRQGDTKNQYLAETNTYHENIPNSKTACVRTERQQVGTK